MNNYVVIYEPVYAEHFFGAPLLEGFHCQADDPQHAEEQCLNAYPDSEIIWVYLGDDFDDALDAFLALPI